MYALFVPNMPATIQRAGVLITQKLVLTSALESQVGLSAHLRASACARVRKCLRKGAQAAQASMLYRASVYPTPRKSAHAAHVFILCTVASCSANGSMLIWVLERGADQNSAFSMQGEDRGSCIFDFFGAVTTVMPVLQRLHLFNLI